MVGAIRSTGKILAQASHTQFSDTPREHPAIDATSCCSASHLQQLYLLTNRRALGCYQSGVLPIPPELVDCFESALHESRLRQVINTS